VSQPENAELLAERRARKRELLMKISEEKKIVEEEINENNPTPKDLHQS
jgi:hypothetical protein